MGASHHLRGTMIFEEENPLASMLSQHNFYIDGVFWEASNTQPCTIQESIHRVDIPKQYDVIVDV
jgi:hypothetical protein